MVQHKKSNKNRKIHRKTQKNRIPPNNPFSQNSHTRHIVKIFMEILNMVKLYHWKTRSYAQHKATDELYSKLNEDIDKFIEILLGKTGIRTDLINLNLNNQAQIRCSNPVEIGNLFFLVVAGL